MERYGPDGEQHPLPLDQPGRAVFFGSDMQTEFYKLITERIETRDPETGKEKWLPIYIYAWSEGRGNYVLKDTDDGILPVENPSEWRRLKIINHWFLRGMIFSPFGKGSQRWAAGIRDLRLPFHT